MAEDKRLALSSEEEALAKAHELDDEQILWRRMKIAQLGLEKFRRQYPEDDDSCFMMHGRPRFDRDALKRQRQNIKEPKVGDMVRTRLRVRFVPNKSGYLRVWEEPIHGEIYVIGADFSGQIEHKDETQAARGDYDAAQVLKVRNMEQVAALHGRLGLKPFARELIALGEWYNWAMVAPERSPYTLFAIDYLQDHYDNLYAMREMDPTKDQNFVRRWGYEVNSRTKPMLIAFHAEAIRDHSYTIHDEGTLQEHFSYQDMGGGKAEAPSGEHDDLVIALAIAGRVREEVVWEVVRVRESPDVVQARAHAEHAGRSYALDKERGVHDIQIQGPIGY